MLHSNSLLKKFQDLHQQLQGPLFFEPGQRIGRGFADLGFEEFVLQGGNKIASLYTGKVGLLPQEHQHFFFNIYDADQLLEILAELGLEDFSISQKDQRNWYLHFALQQDAFKNCLADSVLELCLDIALSLGAKK